MLALIIAAAHGAGPANGDFESDLTPWEPTLGPGAELFRAEQGTDFGDLSDPSTIPFPSGDFAMGLRAGPSGIFTVASARSEPFVVTWTGLGWRHRAETADAVDELRVDRGATRLATVPFGPDANGAFDSAAVDLEAHCGAEVTLQFVHYAAVDLVTPFTLVDAIAVEGAVCPAYADVDGDGWCPHGRDLDLDQRCDRSDEAEPASAPVRDCDDGDPTRSPDAAEVVADGIDQDCDGVDPTGLCYADGDGDGFGSAEVASPLCDQPGEVPLPGDCDDTNGAIRPGAADVPGDGVDQDCDGFDLCYVDGDDDGFGTTEVPGSLGCSGAGEGPSPGDCDDLDPLRFPGAPERCNTVDDDCDGQADPGAPMQVFPDADGDGYGAAGSASFEICGGTGPSDATDCDDLDPDVSPAATEIAGDGVDQDCDGMELCYVDVDLDGYGGPTTQLGSLSCAGLETVADDCDDATPQVNPGRPEVCNTVDDDCDGSVDEGLPVQQYYEDTDGDGFGGGPPVSACAQPGPTWRVIGGDCDDTDAGVNPSAPEIRADGLDQNCDGGETCYRDVDGDGFGTDAIVLSDDLSCAQAGESALDSDCDDGDPRAFPGAEEVGGNGVDEDCDGADAPGDTGDTAVPVEVDPSTVVWRGGSTCATAPGSSIAVGLGLVALIGRRRRGGLQG